tara:strand:- start:834 stop:1265 length:432 start_codon:yes stop_codon:yes gene_type:complete
MNKTCARCNVTLVDIVDTEGIRQDLNANYVIGPESVADDFVEKVELLDALNRRILLSEPLDAINLQIQHEEKIEGELQTLKKTRASRSRLNEKAQERVAVARTVQVTEPVQKTHLICTDCLVDTDYIIWGVDKGKKNLEVEAP